MDNVFGILSSVFRVFRKPILLSEQKVSQITMTCVLLHNYLRRSKTSSGIYSPPGVFDNKSELQPGSWREDGGSMTSFMSVQRVPRRSELEPLKIRDLFADYFVSNGAVA